MEMRQAGQASLQRHGNILRAEIEHDETEAAGAQKFFAGARKTLTLRETHDHERCQISAAARRIGRIKKIFIRSHPADRLAALLGFPDQSESDRQRRGSRRARYFDQPPSDFGQRPIRLCGNGMKSLRK